MRSAPRISIIICTHNRKGRLLGLLETLAVQSVPPGEFEVIVVADACTDGTEHALRARLHTFPYRLTLAVTSAGRPAVPRNLGASRARSPLLLFVDDDMAAGPRLVEAHLGAQQTAEVVAGYARSWLPPSPRLWQIRAAEWWEDRYAAMRRPDHIFGYDDLITTNVSVTAARFRSVGGFDETLDRLEDYDLGIRLIRAGARFGYADEAVALHRDTGEGTRWLARLGVEGATYALLERRYPWMRGAFHREPPSGTWSARIRRFSLRSPDLVHRLIPVIHHGILAPLERMKARGFWERGLAAYGELTYWSGVTRMDTARGDSGPPPAPPPSTTLRVDPDGMRMPDDGDLAGAGAVEVRLLDIPVGEIRSHPRGEPLTRRHVQDPLAALSPDPWTGIAFTRSLTHALHACTGPTAILRHELERAGPLHVPADAESVCLAVFHNGVPLGFYPVGRAAAARLAPDHLRQELLSGSRIFLRARAAENLLAATWENPETVAPSTLVVVEGSEPDRRATLDALEPQTLQPTRVVAAHTGAPAPISGTEAVVVFLRAGLLPEPAWLESLLRRFADPATGAVVGLELPAGVLTDRLRRDLACCSPPPGLDSQVFQPLTGDLEQLRQLREWHECRSLAVRRELLAGVDGAHILHAANAYLSGYSVWHEPSAVLWDPAPVSPVDPSRSATRGRERRHLRSPGEPGSLRTTLQLLVRGSLRAGRIRSLAPLRAAAAELAGTLSEPDTAVIRRHVPR
jgi:glycosyltransferase involved in cell wall biosynthesis